MLSRVLCVDDEPNVLQAFERQFRTRFSLVTAIGPEAGLQAIRDRGPFAVAVSDLRMPVMDGVQFLGRVRELSPDTVRIMLTGQADLTSAIAAVNIGSVFQFLAKPCPTDMLLRALEAAVKQHRLLTAERELLEKTVRGSIELLSEVLGLVNPPAFSRAHRIRRYVRHIAEALNLTNQFDFELAAMLSQVGCVIVPPEVLEKVNGAQSLNAEEQEIMASQAHVGSKLLAHIPRLELAAQIVARQDSKWSGRKDESDPVLIGGHLLRVALTCDAAMVRGGDFPTVLAGMTVQAGFNPAFVAALAEVQLEESKCETRLIKLAELKIGMLINSEVCGKNGVLLLGKGQEVTESAIARLKSFSRTVGIIEPIRVVTPYARRVPAADNRPWALPDRIASTSSDTSAPV